MELFYIQYMEHLVPLRATQHFKMSHDITCFSNLSMSIFHLHNNCLEFLMEVVGSAE